MATFIKTSKTPGPLNNYRFKTPAKKKPAPKPVAPKPTAAVNLNAYRTNPTTIADLTKRGFDYSKGFAQQQAQALADSQRAGLNTQMKQVDANVRGANDSLNRNYFQQYMNQQQNQVGAGINGGIQADQNLRLSMNRQSALGNMYRDAAVQKSGIQANLSQVDQQRVANANKIYNDRLQQAFQNAQGDTAARRGENLALMGGALQQRGQNVGMDQWQKNFDEQKRQWQSSFNQGRTEYADNKQWREYIFNHMSESERASLEWAKQVHGEDAAWKYFEMKYQGELQQSMNQAQIDFYSNAGLAGIP